MSSDVQEQIISAIFERRPIWNSKDVNHKNRRIMNQLWEEIKNELNIEDISFANVDNTTTNTTLRRYSAARSARWFREQITPTIKRIMPEPNKQDTLANTNPERVLELEQPTREISQTDHINKKLLTSLFNRMDSEAANNTLEADSDAANDDEWK